MRKILATIGLTLTFVLASAQVVNREPDRQHLVIKNNITNPGGENGLVGWSETGGGTMASESTAANIADGSKSVSFDAAANGDKLDSPAMTVPPGLYNRNCLAKVMYKGGDTNLKINVSDGTNTLNSVTLVAATTYKRETLSFICPSSGTINVEVEATANAAIIYVDDVVIGENYLVGQVSQAELVAHIVYPATASCLPALDNANFATLPAVAACPAPTVIQSTQTVNTTDNDKLDIVFDSLTTGTYHVTAYTTVSHAAASNVGMRIVSSSGAANGRGCSLIATAASSDFQFICSYTETITVAKAVTWSIQLAETAAGAVTALNDTGGVNGSRETEWVVERYPLSSQTVFTPDVAAWTGDWNIGGANGDLGTAAQTAYTPIGNSLFDLVTNPGSLPANITCNSTNPSTGSNCDVGTELIGVEFNVPRAGKIEVCMEFGHAIVLDQNETLSSIFQIVERQTNDQTVIIQEGKSRVSSQARHNDGAANTSQWGHPINICGTFDITSSGPHAFGLYYEQSLSGLPNTNIVLGDRAGTEGQRDIHITARPLDSNAPMPVIVNSVATTSAGSVHLVSAFITNAGSCVVTTEDGDWINGTPTHVAGKCTITINSGVFSVAPVCTVTPVSNTVALAGQVFGTPTTTSVVTATHAFTGTATDANFHIICVGEK